VVLVLEEAHHYIPVRDAEKPEDQSVSKKVFERIAKEGRKYGLGLLVASQRPSELSHTVLAQCNSFIVHRLQNPRDLEYFKSVVPAAFEDLLGQLPVLPQQTAMVLGECVPAPVLMRVNDAVPTPRSEDPRFMDHWISEKAYEPPFEDICAEWEGCTAGAVASEDEASACAGCCEDGCGCAEVVDCSYEFEQQGLDNGLDAATLLAAHGEPPDAAWLADAYEEWSAQAQEEGDG
jgi:hypothetical protein